MDQGLRDLIDRLNAQNEVLAKVRAEYLKVEATKKYYEARLIGMAKGKSMTERVMEAHSSEGYKTLCTSIANLESSYEFEKLKFSILEKEYLACHLSFKVDHDTMRKG